MIVFSIIIFNNINVTFGQVNNQYALDMRDSSTYMTSCGTINPAQWTVKKDSCAIYTPTLFTADSARYIHISVRVNQSGNLKPTDKALIQYQLNSGVWITKSTMMGSGLTSVFSYDDSIKIGSNDFFRIRIVLVNSNQNEFWSIKNGDIIIAPIIISTVTPVTLLNFSLKKENTKVVLNWATATETNNDFFNIETHYRPFALRKHSMHLKEQEIVIM